MNNTQFADIQKLLEIFYFNYIDRAKGKQNVRGGMPIVASTSAQIRISQRAEFAVEGSFQRKLSRMHLAVT